MRPCDKHPPTKVQQAGIPKARVPQTKVPQAPARAALTLRDICTALVSSGDIPEDLRRHTQEFYQLASSVDKASVRRCVLSAFC
ncbi:hypothetical protein MELB17_16026 [Marinobacter sp. ELB17]|nr:hypothetical protein MELB17_16026 [Marinobacter sp. ELB17]